MPTPFDSQTFAALIDRGLLQIGDGHRAKLAELGGNGPIFLRAGLVSDAGIHVEGADRFRKDVAVPSAKFARARDTFVTTKGNSVGRASYIAVDLPQVVYSPHLSYWRSLDAARLHPEFLRYWARSPDFVSQLHAMAHGTDMAPYLSLVDQKRLVIPLPSIHEQRCIAGILGALDDKIDSNRRLAGLLEETAATLFRARFVDFVGVEEFEDSELGPMPCGWSVGRLGDLVDVVMGQSPPGSSYSEDPAAGMLMVQGMGGFGERFPNSTIHTSAPTKRVRAGTTLMTVRAPVGAVNVTRVETCAGRGVAGVVSQFQAFAEFLVRSLSERWASQESGTIFPAVNRRQVVDLPVVVPPRAAIADYDRTAGALVEKLAALHDETMTLASVRDALLPKLVSGEIRVLDLTDPAEAIEPMVA